MLDRSHEQMDVRDCCPSTSECDRYRSNPINPMNREILTVGRCRALYGPQSTPPLLSSNRDNSNPQPHNSATNNHTRASKRASRPTNLCTTKPPNNKRDRSIDRSRVRASWFALLRRRLRSIPLSCSSGAQQQQQHRQHRRRFTNVAASYDTSSYIAYHPSSLTLVHSHNLNTHALLDP